MISPARVSTEGAPSAQPSAPAGVRLLVVDDDAYFRRSVIASMTRAGFHVLAADDGAPAIAQAEATPPDIALVDLNMPTSGLDVVRRLKELYGAAVHVSVLSGSDDEDARLSAFEAGADDFLIKPLSAAELRVRMTACARAQQAYVEARVAREHAERVMIYGAEAGALLAHDLNNGLAVALTNMRFLAESAKIDDPDDRSALEASLRALQRMTGLVANFVDIARFEDAAIRLQCELVDVRGLLDEVAAVHASVLPAGATCEVVCDRDLVAWFDPAMVERVLHNLVGNAVRYCDKGGKITIRAQSLRGRDLAAGTEISIQNSGSRIADELLNHLFSKYGRGTNGKRGLGLYFCRLACEAHGGAIDATNLETGPSFVIRIPGRT